MSDLSSFVKKSVDTELKSWEERQSFLPVERYIGFFKEGASKFLLVSEASPMEYVSLTEYIRVKGKRNESGIPLKAKIKTLKNLSQAMHQVVQLWDNVSHGHLCPNNILVNHFKKPQKPQKSIFLNSKKSQIFPVLSNL